MKKLMYFSIIIFSLLLVGTLGFFLFGNQSIEENQAIPLNVLNSDKESVLLKNPRYVNGDLDAIFDEEIEPDVLRFDLKSHPSVVFIKQVGAGNQVVMWYDVNSVYQLENALGNPEFTNMKTGQKVQRDWRYVVWGNETYENPITSCIKKISVNGTSYEDCIELTENKTREAWLPYNSKDLPKGQMRIGIEVEVGNKDFIDGVWNVGGKRIDRHAQWEGDLFLNVVAYYPFNETSGSVIDMTGNYPGTNNGVDRGQVGKINNSFFFNGGTDNVDVGNLATLTGSNMSVSVWINTSNVNQFGTMIQRSPVNSKWIFFLDTDKINWRGSSTTADLICGIGLLSNNTWHNLIATADGVNANMYVDGVLCNSTTSFSAVDNSGATTTLIGIHSSGGSIISQIDEVPIFNKTLNQEEVDFLYNQGNGCFYGNNSCGNTISITLLSPENNANLIINNINFSANVLDPGSFGIQNVTIKVFNSTGNLVFNETNTSGLQGFYNFSNTFSEGDYDWNITAYDDSNINYSSVTQSFTIDTTNPVINISYPTNTTYRDNYTTSPTIDIQLNWTSSDDNLDSCWYYNTTTNVSITCGNNATITLPYGQHTFIIYANDTAGNLGSDNVTATWNYKLLQNAIFYNANAYEISEEEFEINISSDGTQIVIGNLVYNGTSYTATKSGDNNNANFSRSITIPTTGNLSFYWNFNYGSEIINSSTYYQNVTSLTLSNCSSGTVYFNLHLKDEETEDFLSASNNISIETTFIYYVNNPNANKTFSDSFNSNNVSFCLTPAVTNIKIFGGVEYEDAIHVKEKYFFIDDTFTNSSATNITLYDLLSVDSTSFVVYLVDSASLPLDDSYFKLNRKYLAENQFKIVEMATSDDSGLGILHFVTEDETYKIDFYSSNGTLLYTTSEFPAVCLDTICSLTFTLPFSSQTNPFEEIEGNPDFTYALNKTNDIVYLVFNSENGTGYDVLFEVYGISVANDTISICSETQTSVSSGSANCNVSSQNYDSFLARVWVDGKLEVSRYVAEFNDGWQTYGTDGVIYALLIVLTLTLLFAWHWILALIGSVTGLVLSMLLQFIPGTFATISYLVVVIIYLIVTGGGNNQ